MKIVYNNYTAKEHLFVVIIYDIGFVGIIYLVVFSFLLSKIIKIIKLQSKKKLIINKKY